MEALHLLEKTIAVAQKEGLKGCRKKIGQYVIKKMPKKYTGRAYKDILFISGCNEDLPHPWRYRVKHQREQLEAYNYTTDEIYFTDIKQDLLRFYHMFIFFRCPETEEIALFVELAKRMNKKVVYDIDDLVIDTRYTDTIKYVSEMTEDDKKAYDTNVRNMQSLLSKCDFAITTTNCLQEELRKYISKVYINRNVASEEMIFLSRQALNRVNKNQNKVKIGYFSGSITHNADFELLHDVIIRVMRRHEEVELYLAGELDLPEDLEPFQSRIKKIPFMDWKKLPAVIAEMDINLAPLEDTIFNRAKSENKWIEAALVKVVTIASDVGAFHDCIEDGKTGVLCQNVQEWDEALEKLISDPEYRSILGERAYQTCLSRCTTIKSGYRLSRIVDQEFADHFAFVLPGLAISGGVRVVLKHALMLQKVGKQVSLFCLDTDSTWYNYEDCRFPVLSLSDVEIKGKVNHMIATMWTTVKTVENCTCARDKCYLVQNLETDFYTEGNALRIQANQSYMPNMNMRFLTISKWCQSWLLERYGKRAQYAPNGIDASRFSQHRRSMEGRIRILIEGDCSVDYKNVDEAFRIVERLDPDKYEVWYMSYNAKPKDYYRVDHFLHKIPYDKVFEVYGQCDILLKTSLLESFSYPPLEMMASGGYVVVVPNGGNSEYLVDKENCLLYKAGNIDDAVEKIEILLGSRDLQNTLFKNGVKTAKLRDWQYIERNIIDMYCGELY